MTYLKRGQTSGTSRRTFTVSTWVKLTSGSDNEQRIFDGYDGGGYYFYWKIRTVGNGHTMQVFNTQSSAGGTNIDLITNRKFRDYNSWYHFCLQVDTTQSTASNRVKIYVNGVQETSFSTATYPPINTDLPVSVPAGADYYIGKENTAEYLLSHYYYVDGSIIDVGQFGSVDSTTGEWKINTSPTIASYGTNGFAVLKDGTTITDQSPNSNNLTSHGTGITKTEDCPSNVFATWNPNLAMNSTMTLANGNTTGTTGSNYASGASNCWFSTIGVSSGKWYGEFKESAATNNQGQQIGVGYDLSKFQQGSAVNAYNVGYIPEGWGYLGSEGRVVNNNNGILTGLSTWGVGDTICIALDMDNHKLYFRKNGGSWENSGNPESGSTGTGAISLTTGETYFFGCSDASLSNTYTFQANFGNGYFGTTAVASAGTNASGIGIFEYDVPTGYTALSTKGLNL